MTKLLRKNVRYSWTPECQHSFKILKDKLTTAPVLTLLVEGGRFVVYSDASRQGLDCVDAGRQSYCLCIQTVETS